MSFHPSALNDLRTASRLFEDALAYRPSTWSQQPQYGFVGGNEAYPCRSRHGRGRQQQQGWLPDQIIVPASAINQLFGHALDAMESCVAPTTYRQGRNRREREVPRSAAPRVDVSETREAYHIQADLPGVPKENISISVDHDGVLTLKGQYGHTVSAQQDSAASESADHLAETSSVASAGSTNKYKASVQEDGEYEQVEAEEARPAASTTETSQPTAPAAAASSETQLSKTKDHEAKEANDNAVHLSERFSGSFTRSWRFATPIDPAAISAKMENGVLSLTLPKRQQTSHQIQIA